MVDLQTNIIDKLNWIYFHVETWHKKKMSEDEATKYHKKLLREGNILCYLDGENLIGYVEFWRINYEQFGRIICREHFSGYLENIKDGNIAYVANTWIDEQHRNTQVYKELKLKFFSVNYKCDYFVGEALTKKAQPVKVFKRSNIFKEIKGE